MPPIAPVGPTAPSWTAEPTAAGNAEMLLEDMDANGVDKTVLVQTSWSTWDNGYVADSAVKYPDRFASMGLVDPVADDNAETAVYWMDERGMAGFRFHPDYYPGEEILKRAENEAMFRQIEQRSGIVQIHNRVPNAHQLEYAAGKYPGITWLIDHMMYPMPDMAPGWDEYGTVLALAEHENVLIKISDVHNRSEGEFPFADMHGAVKLAIDAFGIDRCMWGTGYPGHHWVDHGWLSLEDELRLVRDGFSWLKADERAMLLGDNAMHIWDWDNR
jgi:L-fuconolactonase